MNAPKNLGGRPKKKPEDRKVQRSVGLIPADWKKVDDHGGQDWLCEVVHKTKVAPLPGSLLAEKAKA